MVPRGTKKAAEDWGPERNVILKTGPGKEWGRRERRVVDGLASFNSSCKVGGQLLLQEGSTRWVKMKRQRTGT